MNSDNSCTPDPTIPIELARMEMPFGKHRGQRLIDLPEPFAVWLSNQEFPPGRLAERLAMVYEIKVNGLEYLFEPLKTP